MFGFFKHAFIINLDRRPDRLEQTVLELSKVQCTATRFSAIVPSSGNGLVGCAMSHIACLEKAIEENYPHVFICEDDICFLDVATFTNSLQRFSDWVTRNEIADPVWDVLLVSGNINPPFVDHEQENGTFRVGNSQTASGYIVRSHYYSTLLANFKEGLAKLEENETEHAKYGIDIYWKRLQIKHRWFIVAPLNVIQRDDYSDIQNRFVSYGSVMLSTGIKQKTLHSQDSFIKGMFKGITL